MTGTRGGQRKAQAREVVYRAGTWGGKNARITGCRSCLFGEGQRRDPGGRQDNAGAALAV